MREYPKRHRGVIVEPLFGVQGLLAEEANQRYKRKQRSNEYYRCCQFIYRRVMGFDLVLALHFEHLFSYRL